MDLLIPKGTFMMGSPESEEGRQRNENPHEVTISKDYYLGLYEVTQAQYEKVMGKNPSRFTTRRACPHRTTTATRERSQLGLHHDAGLSPSQHI
ncbi:MAG: formylglycine-generating enzyme family protein [Planctomycetota bacterium]|jgi:formylglycine-generating enzyme required for sulfatase activity